MENKPTPKAIFLLNLAGIMFLSLGILLILFLSSQDKTKVEIIEKEEGETELVVDLQGAVENPGVYRLKTDSRLNDLLILAGGLAQEADREWVSKNINLSQKLSDGIKIYIPTRGELKSSGSVAGLASENSYEKININLADQAELEKLSGIGPATAQKIIDYRQKNGPFDSIEAIMSVPGIGQKTFDKIKDQLVAW